MVNNFTKYIILMHFGVCWKILPRLAWLRQQFGTSPATTLLQAKKCVFSTFHDTYRIDRLLLGGGGWRYGGISFNKSFPFLQMSLNKCTISYMVKRPRDYRNYMWDQKQIIFFSLIHAEICKLQTLLVILSTS